MQRALDQGQTVTGDHDVAFLKTPDGALQILTVGSDGSLNWIRRDPESESGWARKTIPNITVMALKSVNDFDSAHGNAIFAIIRGRNSYPVFAQLEYSPAHDTLVAAAVSGPIRTNGRAQAIVNFSVQRSQSIPNLFQLSATVRRANTGLATCFVQAGPGKYFDRPLWFWRREGSGGALMIAPNIPVIEQYKGVNIDSLYAAIIEGKLIPFSNYNIHRGRYYDDLDVEIDNSSFFVLDATAFAVLEQPAENGQIFAIDNRWSLRTSSSDPSMTTTRWSDWDTISTATVTGQTLYLHRLSAIRLYRGGPIYVFAIDSFNRLWVINQSEEGVWLPAADLGVDAVRVSATFEGRDATDLSSLRIVATTQDGGLTLLSLTGAGEWVQESIEVDNPISDHFDNGDAFLGIATVRSDKGLPMPATTVNVLASEAGTFRVNGRLTVLSDAVAVPIRTDPLGRVVIESLVNDQLGAPSFSIQSDGLSDGALRVKPNGRLEELFASISPDALREATDPNSGQPILPPSANVTEIASALNQVMKSAQQFDDFSDVFVRLAPGDTDLQAQQVCFNEGIVSFALLGSDEFEKMWSEAEDPAGQRGILDDIAALFGISWGDLWEGFRNGVLHIACVVWKEARAVVRIGERVFRYVLDKARQFFDLALGILEVAGAKFGELLGWLLKTLGVFDDWALILRNRDSIKQRFKQATNELRGQIPNPLSYKSAVDTFFSDLEKDADTWFETINRALGIDGNQVSSVSAGRYDLSAVPDLPSPNPFEALESINWLLDKLFAALETALGIPDLSLTKTETAVDHLFATLESDITSDVTSIANNLAANVGNWINNPTTFQELVLSSVVRDVVEPGIRDFIGLGQALTDGSLEIAAAALHDSIAVVDWLDAPLEIPFFSEFYAGFLNGASGSGENNQLSVMDLMALITSVVVSRSLGDLSSETKADGQLVSSDRADTVIATVLQVLQVAYRAALESVSLEASRPGGTGLSPEIKAFWTVVVELSALAAALFSYLSKNPQDRPLSENLRFWFLTGLRRAASIIIAVVTLISKKKEKPPSWLTDNFLEGMSATIAAIAAIGQLASGVYYATLINQGRLDGNRTAVILSDTMLFIGMVNNLIRVFRFVLKDFVARDKDIEAQIVIVSYVGVRALLGLTNAGLNYAAKVENE